MPTFILLGASARAAAFSALRAGYAPYAIDLFADRDLAAICPAVKISRYPDDFLPALAAAPQASWLYTGGLENYPRLVDRLAAIRPLLGNPGNVLRKVRDPKRLRDTAIDAGCRSPEIHGRPNSQQKLIKPRRSSGGIAIRFAASHELGNPPRGTYLQEYIPGESASAIFIAANGQAVLLGATRQLLGRDFDMPRPFLYVGSLGPLALSEFEKSQIESLGNILANQFHLVGLFNVDFIQSDAGVWPVEVNPRYSASMEIIERVTSLNLVDLHVQACQSGAGIPIGHSPPRAADEHFGKAIVYAAQDRPAPSSLEDLARDWNTDPHWPTLADLPRTGEPIPADQPVLTTFAQGTSLTDVETQLRHRITAIQRILSDL